jgi:mono/diheme cytochrome c family protein
MIGSCDKARLAASVLAALMAMPGGARAAEPTYTTEQAARGQASYEHSCMVCHGSTLDNGDFGGPPLRGSWFRNHWGSADAAALFGYVKVAMPPDNPGGLNDTTYADIVAYILQVNGYQAGSAALPADAGALGGMSLAR